MTLLTRGHVGALLRFAVVSCGVASLGLGFVAMRTCQDESCLFGWPIGAGLLSLGCALIACARGSLGLFGLYLLLGAQSALAVGYFIVGSEPRWAIGIGAVSLAEWLLTLSQRRQLHEIYRRKMGQPTRSTMQSEGIRRVAWRMSFASVAVLAGATAYARPDFADGGVFGVTLSVEWPVMLIAACMAIVFARLALGVRQEREARLDD